MEDDEFHAGNRPRDARHCLAERGGHLPVPLRLQMPGWMRLRMQAQVHMQSHVRASKPREAKGQDKERWERKGNGLQEGIWGIHLMDGLLLLTMIEMPRPPAVACS